MKGSKIFGTLTILFGCAGVLFLSELPKVMKYRAGDIKDFSEITCGELKKGDLVQGTIDITDGCIAEMEETNTTFGIETSKRTSARYYACYTCSDFYVLYQTGNEGQFSILDKMADESEAYSTAYKMLAEDEGTDADFSKIPPPETTLDFTAEVEAMPSDLLPIFRNWYGEGFDEPDECEQGIVIRYSRFDRFEWVVYAGIGCAAAAVLMLVLTIRSFIRQKRDQQYGY